MRIKVKRECAEKFLDAFSWKHVIVTDIHDDEDGWEWFTQAEQIGYAEPNCLYEKVKDYVHDIWWTTIGDVDLKVGKDNKGDGWESCKKKFIEEVITEQCSRLVFNNKKVLNQNEEKNTM